VRIALHCGNRGSPGTGSLSKIGVKQAWEKGFSRQISRRQRYT
jgi:hypothetical protein